jgi:hypothetical protein
MWPGTVKLSLSSCWKVLLAAHLARDFTEDETQHVLHGDDAEDLAVLADDHGGAGVETLEVLQHLVDLLGRRNEVRRLEDFPELDRRTAAIGVYPAQQIFGVQESDDVVPVAAIDRNTRVAIAAEAFDQLVDRQIAIEEADARTQGS